VPQELLSDTLQIDRKVLEEMNNLSYVLDCVQHSLVIINKNSEIVHANKLFLNLLDAENLESVIGYNLENLIKCADSFESSLICDPTVPCLSKSIEDIISSCSNLMQEVKVEYRICVNSKIMDTLLVARPLNIKRHTYMVISLIDISDTKWKKALERIFFHDLLNSAGALKECLNLMDIENIGENGELLSISKKISDNLVDEITSHRQLLLAERNEYEPKITKFDCNEIIMDVSHKAKYSFLAEDKNLLTKYSESVLIHSDKTLVSRAIFNLVKNALEATKKNGTVELYCVTKDNNIEFIVKNGENF
jgi:nitrogen-specific signal transduction histidine kinase